MNNVLKILQLNKGDSELQNRTDQINEILTKYKPHIVIINELNNYSNDQITKHSFTDYTLETDNLESTDLKSRTGMLINNKIHYKRRRDLETLGTSTLWIQLSHPGRIPILVQGVYRQFQRLGKPNSDSLKNQKSRWKSILEKWEVAILENREIITLGDFNLNSLGWQTPMVDKTPYEKQQYPMVEMLNEKILQKGFKILNTAPTRLKDTVDSKPSCLDFIITNKIEKVASYQSEIPTFSDHSLQILHRTVKNLQKKPKIHENEIVQKF